MSKLVTVRHSELKTFRQCPLKWHLAWKQGWSPKVLNPKLGLGTQWHLLLEHYFKAIQSLQQSGKPIDPQAVAEEVVKLLPAIVGADHERQELLLWMFAGYIEHHGAHPDWEVVAVEKQIVIPLFYYGHRTRYRLQMRADLIVRSRSLGKRLIVVDHKSAGDLVRQLALDLDDQLGLYVLGVSRHANEKVLYPMLNQARTKRLQRPMLLSERFSIKPSFRTEAELIEIEADMVRTCREMVRPRDGIPYSAPSPMTCTWSCDFIEAHIAMRRSGGRDTEEILKAQGMIKLPPELIGHYNGEVPE